jgi:hypothetical protein
MPPGAKGGVLQALVWLWFENLGVPRLTSSSAHIVAHSAPENIELEKYSEKRRYLDLVGRQLSGCTNIIHECILIV